MRKIIFATSNEGKMKEIRMMLSNANVEVLSLKDINLHPNIVENGSTFEENALIKATEVMKLTGEIVLADDSGLEVDYMNKEPGVYSARWLGEDTPYAIKNQKIIDNLNGVEDKDRSARFVCVIAAAFPDGRTYTARGEIEGEICTEERGQYGFGYDPILYVPEYGKTTGEMLPDFKNGISHRGKALKRMVQILIDEKVI